MIKFAKPSELARAGILGINQRNGGHIAHYNPRQLYPLLEDKLETKLLAEEFSIPTPKLSSVLRYWHEIRGLEKLLEPLQIPFSSIHAGLLAKEFS